MNPNVSIIGAGRLGGALAIALSNNDFKIVNVVSRTLASARNLADKINSRSNVYDVSQISNINFSDEFSELVLIATPDSQIPETVEQLAANQSLKQRQTVFLHTSGALSSAVLLDLKSANAQIGSLHPLVSVSDQKTGAKKFANAYFCVEGDDAAVACAETIVAVLNSRSFTIPTQNKVLYHAAAVLSAGHLIALFDLAAETLSDCGIERAQANQILLPLVSSAVENLTAQTPAQALTGTFARADVETMKKHLASLRGKAADEIYRELGKRSIELARAQGADRTRLEEMKNLIVEKSAKSLLDARRESES